MTRFRPCIDLHAGQVKQIVGGTLSTTESDLKTNYVSSHPAGYFAQLYRDADLLGAHVIMLGPGNDSVAKEALAAWPGRLQVGGGITDANAREWIEAGAERVIITSFLFPNGRFSLDRLKSVLASLDNDTSKLVIDLSCRRKGETWFVAMNKWQTITEMEITKGKSRRLCITLTTTSCPAQGELCRAEHFIPLSQAELTHRTESIRMLEPYCSEFLIHAADNEGLQQGIDTELVHRLAEWCGIPITYAGGARTVDDLDLVKQCSGGKVDLTIGSALDVFGGTGARFEDCVRWNGDNAR
ncbi:Enzyme that catalyzes the fourth step in the histidine pathway [Elasticomyces elasticus]|uniref:Enzyme that catalyzes the fourth step in the histidine pathway n=1 Tax=Exophiala sideris TaxID=1016849 RepID=A0ABR0JAM8_9EURO|nr:Enzyme that catalyzes the fourth step in the histidine pathway [Elasticomyces elasticus]KAK5027967.1 Enzyme that catalyzes the fourth step in the histidine pathway [Exophiala sideris]KAK5037442.1 Enzyme that catalyzes the fourth step in the histidine pathway [Exophiala sideris]KAK5059104.1 Enzyme that catalyzes the fourth step in the histidine pathway [Exophiala sideris]KAK5182937.1 Enzyme that catalyzes the fourth step in the histidine pathway [Eurotiomycetes sp. CCFEE 6388]